MKKSEVEELFRRFERFGPDKAMQLYDRGIRRLSDATFGVLADVHGVREYLVAAIPILPHGGWVVWTG